MPVLTRAVVRIRSPRIMIEVSLPNPSKAVLAGTIPVNTRAIITPRAVTSAGIVSIENNTRAIKMMIMSRIIEVVIVCPFAIWAAYSIINYFFYLHRENVVLLYGNFSNEIIVP